MTDFLMNMVGQTINIEPIINTTIGNVQRKALLNIDRQLNNNRLRMSRGIKEVLKRMDRQVNDGGALLAANKRVAQATREGVMNEYIDRVDMRRSGPSYSRPGREDSGALERAIDDPNFVRADRKGFALISQSVLTAEGEYWARLNWGAGRKGASGQRPTGLNMKISGVSSGISFAPVLIQGPRPGFSFPGGGDWKIGVQPGRGMTTFGRVDLFRRRVRRPPSGYTLWITKPIPETSGIEARYFLEHGLKWGLAEFDRSYTELIRKWTAPKGRR